MPLESSTNLSALSTYACRASELRLSKSTLSAIISFITDTVFVLIVSSLLSVTPKSSNCSAVILFVVPSASFSAFRASTVSCSWAWVLATSLSFIATLMALITASLLVSSDAGTLIPKYSKSLATKLWVSSAKWIEAVTNVCKFTNQFSLSVTSILSASFNASFNISTTFCSIISSALSADVCLTPSAVKSARVTVSFVESPSLSITCWIASTTLCKSLVLNAWVSLSFNTILILSFVA